MAKEIKQRMYALFAVLGIVIFFWFSFHQNGMSLSFFARDFVDSSAVAPEVWQAINPFFVIVLTPMIMAIFGFLARRGKKFQPQERSQSVCSLQVWHSCSLPFFSIMKGYPSADTFRGLPYCRTNGSKSSLVGSYRYLLLPDSCRVVHLSSWIVVCIKSCSKEHAWLVSRFVACCYRSW